MPTIFYFKLFTSWTCENLTELPYNIAEHTVISQCSIQSLQIVIFHLWQELAFPSGKSCSPSSAATVTWHAAVPCYLYNVCSKALDQRSNNLMVQGQDRREDAATLSIQNLLFLWTSYLVGQTVNSNSYTEPLRNLNARLWVGPHKNTSEALLLHNNTRLHISVCTTEAITSFGYMVMLHSPYWLPLKYTSCNHQERKKKRKKEKNVSQHCCMQELMATIFLNMSLTFTGRMLQHL